MVATKKQQQQKKQQPAAAAASKKKQETAAVAKQPAAGAVQKQQQQHTAKRAINKGLFEARKRNFSFGNDRVVFRPKLTTCVKFPRYVRLQRRLKTIKARQRCPAPVHQFVGHCDVQSRRSLSEFLRKNAPETKKERTIRIKSAVEQNQKNPKSKSCCVHYGVQEVTRLVSQGKAKLCVIAGNVDREIVTLPLPSLCVHNNIPYMIVSDKAWLGKHVHQKKVSCLAITEAAPEFKSLLENLSTYAKLNYNDQYAEKRTLCGEPTLSERAKSAAQKKQRLAQAELEKAERLKL